MGWLDSPGWEVPCLVCVFLSWQTLGLWSWSCLVSGPDHFCGFCCSCFNQQMNVRRCCQGKAEHGEGRFWSSDFFLGSRHFKDSGSSVPAAPGRWRGRYCACLGPSPVRALFWSSSKFQGSRHKVVGPSGRMLQTKSPCLTQARVWMDRQELPVLCFQALG